MFPLPFSFGQHRGVIPDAVRHAVRDLGQRFDGLVEDDEFDVQLTAYDSGSTHYSWKKQLYDSNANFVDHPSGMTGSPTWMPAKTFNGEVVSGLPKYVRIRKRGLHPSYGPIYEIINPTTGAEYLYTGVFYPTAITPSFPALPTPADVSHDRIYGGAGQFLLSVMVIAQCSPSSGSSVMAGGFRRVSGTEVIHHDPAVWNNFVSGTMLLHTSTTPASQSATHWTYGFEFSDSWEIRMQASTYGNGTSDIVSTGVIGGYSRFVLTKLR